MKTQLTNQKNRTNGKVKVLIGAIAAIGVLTVSGCQEAAAVTRSQVVPLQNQSVSSDKVLTLAVFPENETVTLVEQRNVYLVGTQSYADKLMSIYEDSDIPPLPVNTSRVGNQQASCVPLLMITY